MEPPIQIVSHHEFLVKSRSQHKIKYRSGQSPLFDLDLKTEIVCVDSSARASGADPSPIPLVELGEIRLERARLTFDDLRRPPELILIVSSRGSPWSRVRFHAPKREAHIAISSTLWVSRMDMQRVRAPNDSTQRDILDRPELDPEWPEAYHLLRKAEDLMELGEPQQAIELCRRAAQLSPDDDRVLQSYGWFASEMGLFEEARSAMLRAVELDPDDPANWVAYGSVLTELGEYEPSIEALKKAIGEDVPASVRALCCIGCSYVRMGRISEAMTAVLEAYKRARPEEDLYREAQDWASSASDFLLDRADLSLERGDVERALEIGRQATQLCPDHAGTWFNFGVLARKAGAFEEARVGLMKACELEPSSHEIWYSLGNVHRSLELLPEAIDCYRHSLLLEPNYMWALNNLGLTLNDMGSHREALEVLERGLSLCPEDTDLRLNLGIAYIEVGDFSSAIVELQRVVSEAPGSLSGWGWLADAYELSGMDAEARDATERASQIEKRIDTPPAGLE